MSAGPLDPRRDRPSPHAGTPAWREPSSLRVEVATVGEVGVVRLAGKMTLGNGLTALREAVQGLIARDRKQIVLDMLDVPMFDSASVGEIVGCRQQLSTCGGSLKLVAGGKVLDTFRMTRLDSLFDLHPDVDAAVAAFDE